MTALLSHLLASGRVDGVVAASAVDAPLGAPHSAVRILRSPRDVEAARSSQYHPLCYADALREVAREGGRYAITAVPCVLRGLMRLPEDVRQHISFSVCIACGHNVSGLFVDALARSHGVPAGVDYRADLRDKFGPMKDANRYYNCFRFSGREVRTSRFATPYTFAWRRYFFAQKSCFFCPDFLGDGADISAKDAWGRLSSDPLGISLLVVRNAEIVEALDELRRDGTILLEPCGSEEVVNSQAATMQFKHVDVFGRLPKSWRKRGEDAGGGCDRTRTRWAFLRLRCWWRLSLITHRFTGALGVQLLYRAIGCGLRMRSLAGWVRGHLRRLVGLVAGLRRRKRNDV